MIVQRLALEEYYTRRPHRGHGMLTHDSSRMDGKQEGGERDYPLKKSTSQNRPSSPACQQFGS